MPDVWRSARLRERNNAVRLQLHALAYNLGNFMRTLALPKEVEHWSLTTLREKLVKVGAKVVRHELSAKRTYFPSEQSFHLLDRRTVAGAVGGP